jgi:capsule polysaccharide export protein KpsE/RkpR
VDGSTQRTLESSEDQDLALSPMIGDLGELERKGGNDTPILALTRLLWARRIWLRKMTLVSLGIAAIVALLIPNTFEATLQLMPPDNSAANGTEMMGLLMGGSSGGMGGTGSSLAGSLSGLLSLQNPGTLFVGILGSRTIADRLIDRFDLRKVYWRKTYQAARKELSSRTDISDDKKTGLIKIIVRDHDRVRAAAMAQAYVEELDRLLAKVNTSAASRERVFLEQRLSVVSHELDEAGKDLSQFSSKNTTLDPEKQGEAMVQAAAVLQGQLIAMQSELSGLEQIYTSDNVRVRTLKAHVAELEQQLNSLAGKNYTGSTVLDADSLYPSLKQLPILGLRYAELYRRVKVDETVFSMLTQAYELSRVQEAKETPSVKVLDAAVVPEKKSWPPRTLLTIVGGFMGFVFGCCWIIGTELWSEVDPNEPHKKFILQTWTETKPFLEERRSRLLSGIARMRGRNGNSHGPEDDRS